MNNTVNKEEYWHWTEALRVGLCEIDNDHKVIFQLINKTHLLIQKDPESDILYSLLDEVIEYTESHFKREEAIMLASKYPFSENHFALHERFVCQLDQKFDQVKSKQYSMTDFLIFLKDWFVEHIKETDHRIPPYTVGYEADIENELKKIGALSIKQHCKVYLVDDDEGYLELMHDMSNAAGFSSYCFSSGIHFLQTPITNNDLVILDLNMPEKDGIEVMRDLADKKISPTFILVSGFDERVLHSAKQLAESRNLRVAEILCKPIETEEFIDVLTKVHAECNLASIIEKQTENPKSNLQINKNAITVEELKLAFAENQLIVYFQPQIRFDNKQVVGAEVLVRWQHPKRGLVFPDQFIPLAEQHHLMGELTEIVILESIKAYKQFIQADIEINLSVNLSSQNINDLALPEKLGSLLKSHNIAPESFILELTESEILTDTSAALDILNRLRMKGFSLSIDDFGTGDSSLKKLYQSPFSELKIDQHFVKRIEKDTEATAIVKICILLAEEFKLQTVAEGIETQAIWDKLKAIGCKIAQGYFIARPMPAEDLIAFCNKNKLS